MKVICINGAKAGELTTDGTKLSLDKEIYEGEIYTVVRECPNTNKVLCYVLEERPQNFGYVKKRFIPLSNIDERELLRERIQIGETYIV